MTTQPVNTHPEAERIMIDVIRKAPVSKRFRLVQSLTQSALWSRNYAWRGCHRGGNEQEGNVRYVSDFWETTLAQPVRATLEKGDERHALPADVIHVMPPSV